VCGAVGDTYIRLVNNATGVTLASNDDFCGAGGSQIAYTFTSCGRYSIYEGCFSTLSCSGTVAISSTTLAPTLTPTYGGSAPSQVPTIAPTSVAPSQTRTPTMGPTVVGQVITYCPAYSAIYTNSAQTNVAVCTFSACEGNYVIGMCPQYGGYNTGDTYIRLVNNATGAILASNDDACVLASSISYAITSCGTYSVWEGCFSSSACSGRVAISSTTLAPTIRPTVVGSNPTVAPSAVPTRAPSVAWSVTMCPAYSATNTNSASQNYATCSFTSCSGSYVIGMCHNGGSYSSGMILCLLDADAVAKKLTLACLL